MEEHFYLVFPVIAWWMLRRPSAGKFVGVCLAVVALGIALRTAVWLHDAALDPPRNWFVEDIYYPTWMRLDGLLMGIVLATLQVFRPHVLARSGARANGVLAIGVGVVALAFWLFRDRTGLLGNSIGWPVLSLGFGLLTLAATSDRSLLGRWDIPGARWIAGISYSLYLSHKLAFHLVQMHLDPRVHGLLAFAAYAVVALLVGAALHYLVERPFLRLRDRRSQRPAALPEPMAA